MTRGSGSDRQRYIEIEMPEQFVLEVPDDDGRWIDHGLYERRAFERGPDGTTGCVGYGSPLFLRCIRQRGRLIDVVDNDGEIRTFRMIPFPSERYHF